MDPTESSQSTLKKRLAELNAEERKALLKKIKSGNRQSTNSDPEVIPKAEPFLVQEVRAESGASQQIRVYPASHTQERMWFLHEMSFPDPVYSSPMSFHLAGELDDAKVEASFQDVVRRHESLRTTFDCQEEGLFQFVHPDVVFTLDRLSLETAPDNERLIEAKVSMKEYAMQAFDLAEDRAIRALLIKLGADEHVLVIVIHHIISDGWTRANLCKELSDAYNAMVSGTFEQRPELDLQFSDYSSWQAARLKGRQFKKSLEYWQEKLANLPDPIELPLDKKRPKSESYSGSTLR